MAAVTPPACSVRSCFASFAAPAATGRATQAYGGIRHLNGSADRPPVRANISLGDSLAGLHAAFGAVMALLHRQAPGGRGAGQARTVRQPRGSPRLAPSQRLTPLLNPLYLAGARSRRNSHTLGSKIPGFMHKRPRSAHGARRRQARGRLRRAQVVDAAISESCFQMLDSCVPEFASHGFDRPPSGSTISGAQRSFVRQATDARASAARRAARAPAGRRALSAAGGRRRGALRDAAHARRQVRDHRRQRRLRLLAAHGRRGCAYTSAAVPVALRCRVRLRAARRLSARLHDARACRRPARHGQQQPRVCEQRPALRDGGRDLPGTAPAPRRRYRRRTAQTLSLTHCSRAQVLGDWVAARTLHEVLDAMAAARVPSGAPPCIG